jgi:tetratricopeptide (TPR) repeat protein
MDEGRYTDSIGEEGGFRGSIRDAERQRELIEEESLAGGETVEERNLARARKAYEDAPTVPDNINRYAQLLKARLTPEAEEEALRIYMKGFEDTGEYRFRMRAGDIRIERLQRELRELDNQLEEKPDDAALIAQRDAKNTELLELQLEEYKERVRKYPTDNFRKFELGDVLFRLGRHGDAMEYFQPAKDEPKLRVRAGHMLGKCFLADDWYPEAISEFEETLGAVDASGREYELAIRYDLMLALLEAASAESSIDHAKRAKDICSEIARKNIRYRDIRAKRNEVDQIIQRLTAGE